MGTWDDVIGTEADAGTQLPSCVVPGASGWSREPRIPAVTGLSPHQSDKKGPNPLPPEHLQHGGGRTRRKREGPEMALVVVHGPSLTGKSWKCPRLRVTRWRGGSLFPADPISEMSVVVRWRQRVCALQAPAPGRSSGEHGGGLWAVIAWGGEGVVPPFRPVPRVTPHGSRMSLLGSVCGIGVDTWDPSMPSIPRWGF